MEKLGKVERLIIHHSQRKVDSSSSIKLRHIYYREWEDIGYHFIIQNENHFYEIDGKLYCGRSLDFMGAHALGNNEDSIGICLIGNFDKSIPSKKQLEKLFRLIQNLKKNYPTISQILGHNELLNVKKSCPGKFVNMDYIREISNRREFNYQQYLKSL